MTADGCSGGSASAAFNVAAGGLAGGHGAGASGRGSDAIGL
jgi:hypothetical protein